MAMIALRAHFYGTPIRVANAEETRFATSHSQGIKPMFQIKTPKHFNCRDKSTANIEQGDIRVRMCDCARGREGVCGVWNWAAAEALRGWPKLGVQDIMAFSPPAMWP